MHSVFYRKSGVTPYNPRGGRMAANSWNPNSFVFLFSLPIFLGFLEDELESFMERSCERVG
jgi:hypothetical protein